MRPERTPWVIPINEACEDYRYKTIVAVLASQTSKTDGVQLNLIGKRLDDDPVPILYLGPTRNFVERVIEKRVVAMIKSSETLSAKYEHGKSQSKTQKNIAGVTLRLAWAHSATEIAGDPAGLCLCDEYDRMPRDVGGEGDSKELLDNRHATYSDGITVVTSTPTIGTVEAKKNNKTGLEHWEISDDIQSPTWQLWQEGTKAEWAWPCPECNEYFIPRFKLLWWPEKSTPDQALKKAKLACPGCGSLIDDSHKTEMNARGRFVSPGQKVLKDGTVKGDAPETDTASFWVSGLCSPWKTFGQRASTFLKAARSGESERVQAVINTGFGELFRVAGDAPDWEAVAAHKEPYKSGQAPFGVKAILGTVDVQKDRLVYVLRGWGYSQKSWLIEHGELYGDTDKTGVWLQLSALREATYNDYPIMRLWVDSGYRASEVYAFCRKHKNWAFPTKGHDTLEKPIKASRIDVNYKGKVIKNGLQLWHIDTNYFKSWVHDQVESEPGEGHGWHLPEDTTDDYCKQVVAEAKVVKPSGRIVWVQIRKDNHFLDCEMQQVALAQSLGIHKKMIVDKAAAAKPQPTKQKRRRRMLSKGVS